jgi:hypothetical protein
LGRRAAAWDETAQGGARTLSWARESSGEAVEVTWDGTRRPGAASYQNVANRADSTSIRSVGGASAEGFINSHSAGRR